jgi:hypothetical protein
LQEIEDKSCQDQEFDNIIDLNIIEQFMLDLDEIDNRILLYYNQLGTLSKVHRATGISYETLRKAKDRIKKFANTLK